MWPRHQPPPPRLRDLKPAVHLLGCAVAEQFRIVSMPVQVRSLWGGVGGRAGLPGRSAVPGRGAGIPPASVALSLLVGGWRAGRHAADGRTPCRPPIPGTPGLPGWAGGGGTAWPGRPGTPGRLGPTPRPACAIYPQAARCAAGLGSAGRPPGSPAPAPAVDPAGAGRGAHRELC